MEAKMLFGSYYFNIDASVEFKIGPITLTDDRNVIDMHFSDQKFVNLFGVAVLHNLINDSSFGFYITRSENYVHNATKSQEFKTRCAQGINIINNFFFFLWFIKDCSCQLTNLVANMQSIESIIIPSSRIYTLSTGACVPLTFSLEELKQTQAILEKNKEITTKDISRIRKQQNEIKLGFNAPDSSPNVYNEGSRIDRALMFLDNARSASFVPMKIAMYSSILECLFSTGDNAEIIHKISERCAFYLGGTKEEKIKNFHIVKKAYGVRSKLLHGDKIPVDKAKQESSDSTFNTQIEISIEIDKLTRKVLTKVILEDSNKFLQNDMNKFYEELVFS